MQFRSGHMYWTIFIIAALVITFYLVFYAYSLTREYSSDQFTSASTEEVADPEGKAGKRE